MKELVRDRVWEEILRTPGITDRELAQRLGKIQPHINQECRVLEMEGKIRRIRPDGARAKGNFPAEGNWMEKPPAVPAEHIPAQYTQSAGMTVCGYEFELIQAIEPERNKDGTILRCHPQSRYENRENLPLSQYGTGDFCRFSITAAPVPGVYLWVVDGKIVYIGEAANLRQRFNSGYGNISPRNCYVGGQNTNCRMNKILLNLCEEGKQVLLYFFRTERYKAVELELLRQIRTPYNIKDN